MLSPTVSEKHSERNAVRNADFTSTIINKLKVPTPTEKTQLKSEHETNTKYYKTLELTWWDSIGRLADRQVGRAILYIYIYIYIYIFFFFF